MFSSIKQKLTLTYIILIALLLIIINYFSIENMTDSVLSEIEVNTLKTANVISNISRNNGNQPLILKQSVKQYMSSDNSRVLVLDEGGKVIVDSANFLENTVIDNKETRLAFSMKEGLGYYYRDKYILQVAVPITDSTQDVRAANGVVLVSTNVDKAFDNIHTFNRELIMISIAAAIIAVLVTVIISTQITKPIISLSKTARKLGQGKLGETVNIKSKDEIGQLAKEFNNMSIELQSIDQGRTQFIGDVSHELKSPMASIKALIDSLLYGNDDLEVYKEYLRDIDSEIDRLTDLVNSLLNLTRIEEEGINTDLHSLADIIDESVKILRPLANKYKVSISVDIKEYPKVICDKKWIKVALINLIDNAIKYRDINKPITTVDIIGKPTKNGYQLIIEDNAIGIDERDLEDIFEKFYRIDRSRSRDTGGAGIGLSIVNRVIKEHEWEIEINSKVNQGTIFNILIPKTSLSTSL